MIKPSPCIDIHRDSIVRHSYIVGGWYVTIARPGWPVDWWISVPHGRPIGYTFRDRSLCEEAERRERARQQVMAVARELMWSTRIRIAERHIAKQLRTYAEALRGG